MIDVLFITVPNCAQCAKAKKVIDKVQPDFPDMKVTYIDVTAQPEILQRYRVLSAPGIVVNGELRYTGGLDEQAFRTLLKALAGVK
ncbi:MAG: thioredoxin family protein [Pseudomonadota bacterium]